MDKSIMIEAKHVIIDHFQDSALDSIAFDATKEQIKK